MWSRRHKNSVPYSKVYRNPESTWKKLNEKYMQHGSPCCYTTQCEKIPPTARKLPQKHRRLICSMLPIPNSPGSIFVSNRKWLRHTNHNATHAIHTRVFFARCGPYSLSCTKITSRAYHPNRHARWSGGSWSCQLTIPLRCVRRWVEYSTSRVGANRRLK